MRCRCVSEFSDALMAVTSTGTITCTNPLCPGFGVSFSPGSSVPLCWEQQTNTCSCCYSSVCRRSSLLHTYIFRLTSGFQPGPCVHLDYSSSAVYSLDYSNQTMGSAVDSWLLLNVISTRVKANSWCNNAFRDVDMRTASALHLKHLAVSNSFETGGLSGGL